MHTNFFKWINVSHYRAILCLNGHLPDKSFFEQCPIRPVIAVDGSANQLMEHALAPLMGVMIHPQKPFRMCLPKHTKVSLMAMPHAVINSKGLLWELFQMTLSFPGQNSCFNRTTSNIVNIDVLEGAVLALIYTQPMDDGANLCLK